MNETYQSDEAVIETALAWKGQGQGVALATVISTWGSAPRPTGSQIAINHKSAFIGSVSGGCIEASVIHKGLDVIASGTSQLAEFGVSNASAFEAGLACGGTIKLLICPLNTAREALLCKLQKAREQNQSAVYISSLKSDTDQVFLANDKDLPGALGEAVGHAISSDRARLFENDQDEYFLNPFNPPLRLFVIGAVHIAQPLVKMAREAGYEVTVIDPREAFATQQRFPGTRLSTDWPDEALAAANLDLRCAAVTLCHDPKIDDPALVAALKSPCFYIGALGSKKTHAARLERLGASGICDEDLARIHGPVGLSIGAKSPAEIAISILAQMTETLRSKPA